MSEFSQGVSLIELRAAHAENAHYPGGLLYEIARSAITEPVELPPDAVADIIMPPKQPDEKYAARWELIEGAAGAIRDGAELKAEEVLRTAELLDLRKPESISESDLHRIDSQKAVWMVEGGANRTSVVRRQLAIDAMRQVYGERANEEVIYQFGSDRLIPKEKNGQPNPEYAIAQEIASDYLAEEYEFTEFELNVASALQVGYHRAEDSYPRDKDIIDQLVVLEKEGSPSLFMIQPKKIGGGLVDGVNAVYELIMRESTGSFVAEPHFQPVIATNGQYRAKDELQADLWARDKGVNILPPVVLGDEPGYTVTHNGREIVTAERAPIAYVNEIVILRRLNS